MPYGLVMTLKATNGILNVFEDRIEISRKTGFGILSQGIKGDRVLFYKDMVSVEFRKPSMLANGYIKFILTGTSDINASVNMLGMTNASSLKDPNTLILRAFNKQTPIESEQAYNIIMQKISETKNQASVVSMHSSVDIPEQIKKLSDLKDQGVLTEEEFADKKKELLAKI